MFETFVVGELHKLFSTFAIDTEMYFYRTRSGMEVDLILETPRGVLAVEIKNRPFVVSADTRGLRMLEKHFGAEWIAGIVVYRGNEVIQLSAENSIWAMPIHRLI
jgi:hypothetical protein